MITPTQIRMARAALRWTAEQLADAAGVSWATIQRMENAERSPRGKSTEAVQHALESAGIVFIGADEDGGPGVRLKT